MCVALVETHILCALFLFQLFWPSMHIVLYGPSKAILLPNSVQTSQYSDLNITLVFRGKSSYWAPFPGVCSLNGPPFDLQIPQLMMNVDTAGTKLPTRQKFNNCWQSSLCWLQFLKLPKDKDSLHHLQFFATYFSVSPCPPPNCLFLSYFTEVVVLKFPFFMIRILALQYYKAFSSILPFNLGGRIVLL